MARFTMNAEITLKANAAITAIQKFEKGAQGAKKEFSLFGRTVTLDVKRIERNLFAMSAIMGSVFAGILLQSPHVRAEFKRLGVEVLLLNVALGEEMQPTLALFVDGLISLIQIFLELPTPIQEVIAITLLLTIALLAAAVAAVALWAALGPISFAILGIALAIAFLLVFAPEVIQFGDLVKNMGEIISISIISAMDDATDAVVDFFDRFGLIGDIIGTIVQMTANALEFLVVTITNSLALSFALFGLFFESLGKLFSGDFGGFASALGNMLVSVINSVIGLLNTFLILPLNIALKLMDDVAETFGGDINFRMPEIPYVPSFQEGGEVRRDGLIFAHREEELTTKTQARANRRRGNDGSGITINNYNTFKIGSVDSKKRIREMMRESERMNKRNMDRRLKV